MKSYRTVEPFDLPTQNTIRRIKSYVTDINYNWFHNTFYIVSAININVKHFFKNIDININNIIITTVILTTILFIILFFLLLSLSMSTYIIYMYHGISCHNMSYITTIATSLIETIPKPGQLSCLINNTAGRWLV